MLYPNELVISDANAHVFALPHYDAELGLRSKGMVPRDWTKYPLGYYAGEVGMHAVADLPVIPRSEWSERIKDQIATGSRLSDFRNRGMNGSPIPSRDQNGRGYCWYHSGTSAMLLVRARDDMPYVDLSAYAGACKIKNFEDEGGWGAQGLDHQMKVGVPSSQFWPQRSVSRENDNPATWENALLHRFTEGWIDFSAAQYDRTLTFEQEVTCHLLCVPTINDYNWWSHSVAGADAVDGTAQWGLTRGDSGKLMELAEFELFWAVNHPVTGGIAIRDWNSWGDSWSANGMGVLTGNKAVADGCTAPRVATWAAK